MVIVASAALVVLAGIYILTPLFKEPKGNLEVELLAETELDRLLSRKAVIYGNIKDLDFEFKMGRLSEADHNRLRAGYKGEAALILQQLDKIGADEDLDDAIEREITSRRLRLFTTVSDPTDSDQCPSCGGERLPGKKFCPDCGHRF